MAISSVERLALAALLLSDDDSSRCSPAPAGRCRTATTPRSGCDRIGYPIIEAPTYVEVARRPCRRASSGDDSLLLLAAALALS